MVEICFDRRVLLLVCSECLPRRQFIISRRSLTMITSPCPDASPRAPVHRLRFTRSSPRVPRRSLSSKTPMSKGRSLQSPSRVLLCPRVVKKATRVPLRRLRARNVQSTTSSTPPSALTMQTGISLCLAASTLLLVAKSLWAAASQPEACRDVSPPQSRPSLLFALGFYLVWFPLTTFLSLLQWLWTVCT